MSLLSSSSSSSSNSLSDANHPSLSLSLPNSLYDINPALSYFICLVEGTNYGKNDEGRSIIYFLQNVITYELDRKNIILIINFIYKKNLSMDYVHTALRRSVSTLDNNNYAFDTITKNILIG